MKLFVRELTDNRCSFVVDDTRPDIVNLLRRTMVTEVPKMAIDEVEFHMGPIRDEDGNEYDSNSALFDEMISHRLGLVPIPTDIEHFTFREKCECNGAGCPHCTIIYVLNKKGPCTVYSGDLQPLGDMSLKVKEELIPLVKLKEKQALLIYATAVMGNGKAHAKWQPVTVCGYMNYPKVKINNDVQVDDPQKIVAILPKGVLDHQKGAFVLKDIAPLEKKDASFYDSQIPAIDGKKPVEIGYEENKFVFSFETDGSVKAKDALKFALNILSERFEELREQLSGIDEA
ncbi:MAG: DNA-directed RNA polymerase subunit D [Candidatus Thermoplasmatota archaeon]|nr:DNA-directed RNA polymerase subunit D [Candidatus Thermoplasmatota archaeon]